MVTKKFFQSSKILSKTILKIFYLLKLLCSIPVRSSFKYYNRNSTNIIWVFNFDFLNFFDYFLGHTFLDDISLVNAFVKNKYDFKFVFGKRIGIQSKKRIFYTVSKHFNSYNLTNHTSILYAIVKDLELQNNNLFPSSYELQFWENKSFMHKKFDEYKINCPKTFIIRSKDEVSLIKHKLNYPLLLKDVNSSASQGVFNIRDFDYLINFLDKKINNNFNTFLLQERINMRKDLRVTMIGDEIVLNYWRINESKEWKPTSTSYGSKVEFDNFPDKWKDYIIDVNKKMKLRNCAYDIVWNNDDLRNEPMILEVSPVYLPNPPLPNKYKRLDYYLYKKKLTLIKNYPSEYIKIAFELKIKLIHYYFNNLTFK